MNPKPLLALKAGGGFVYPMHRTLAIIAVTVALLAFWALALWLLYAAR